MRFLRPDPLACQEFVELVTDYLEGALSRRERRAFEHHISECDGCTNYFAQMKAVIASAGELPPPAPADPHVREHLLAAFRELRGT